MALIKTKSRHYARMKDNVNKESIILRKNQKEMLEIKNTL